MLPIELRIWGSGLRRFAHAEILGGAVAEGFTFAETQAIAREQRAKWGRP